MHNSTRAAVYSVRIASALLLSCSSSQGVPGTPTAASSAGAAGNVTVAPRAEVPSEAVGTGAKSSCVQSTEHSGDATFYNTTGAGNCSFESAPKDLMIGALNRADYATAAACGACVLVRGPKADITVRIVDLCPVCKPGGIDLSGEAFSKIASPSRGRVPITWHYVACPVQGPIVYHFQYRSNPWWTAVQIRNHRYAIQSVEYQEKDGTFRGLPRTNDNFFLATSGLGEGPYTLRVTDVHGHSVQDSGIPAKLSYADAPGAEQFPACEQEK